MTSRDPLDFNRTPAWVVSEAAKTRHGPRFEAAPTARATATRGSCLARFGQDNRRVDCTR